MDFDKVVSGKNPPYEINVIIEIPPGSSVKYEIDKVSGALVVDRFLYTSMAYSFNYGFIPHTTSEDGDPVDVVLVSSVPVVPGAVISSRPIGLLEMEDESGLDNKIIALPTKKIDPVFAHVEDISEINEYIRKRIKHFFENYKELEPGKWVKAKDFLSRDRAEKEIKNSLL